MSYKSYANLGTWSSPTQDIVVVAKPRNGSLVVADLCWSFWRSRNRVHHQFEGRLLWGLSCTLDGKYWESSGWKSFELPFNPPNSMAKLNSMGSPTIVTAKHLVLPEALSKYCELWVILAFLKSSGMGPVRHCTYHPEPYHTKAVKP